MSDLFHTPPQKWKPYAYQRKAVKFLLERAAGALFIDLGMGKSAITLAALKVLKEKGMLGKVLVLAPLRVAQLVWPEEQKKWSDFHGLKIVVLHGPEKDKRLKEEADICVMNCEGLEWLLGIEKSKTLHGKTKVALDLVRWHKLGFTDLVVDELSMLKNPSTVRMKSLKLVLHTFRRRWGLTAEPAANGLMDLFGEMLIVDQGKSLGRFITQYRANHFQLGYDGFSWKIRPGEAEKIYQKISPLTLRMANEDYLELPELLEEDIIVELPKKVRKIYEAIEDDLIAEVSKGTVVAANAAVASAKCRQCASGGLYVEEPRARPQGPGDLSMPDLTERVVQHLHDAKTDALEELIEGLNGNPLLCAYDFHHDLERLRRRFGKDLPVLGGGTTTKEADRLVTAWNRGDLPVFYVHPQAAARGLNLQGSGAGHIAFYSLTWSLELYRQLIGRLRRQGTTAQRIVVHRLIAKDTVDEVVAKALKSKAATQQALFDGLKALASKRRR